MNLRTMRVITLVCAGLGMTMGAAHLMELPEKMRYGAEMYAAVNTTLYRYFALAGGPIQIGAILAGVVLSFLSRRERGFRLVLSGTICLILSFVLWLALVLPINGEVARAVADTPDTVPSVWMRMRERWEYGHVVAFVAWLTGFLLLTISATAAA